MKLQTYDILAMHKKLCLKQNALSVPESHRNNMQITKNELAAFVTNIIEC